MNFWILDDLSCRLLQRYKEILTLLHSWNVALPSLGGVSLFFFFAIPLKIYYLFWAPEGPIERQSFDGFVLFDRVNRGEMLLLRFNVLESHGFTLFQPATPCATFFFRCFATPAWWLWHHGQMHVYLFRIQATISWFHARPRGGSLSNWNEVRVHFLPKSLRIADLALLLLYCLQYIYIYI